MWQTFGSAPVLRTTLVGQTIAFRGLPLSGSLGRRHKTIVCPTEALLSEQYWLWPNPAVASNLLTDINWSNIVVDLLLFNNIERRRHHVTS